MRIDLARASGKIVLAIAIGASACTPTPGTFKRPNMTMLSPRLAPLFEKTRKVCFGRFVVDVPVDATTIFGSAEVEVPIERFRGQAPNIEKFVAEHLIEVEKDRRFIDRESMAELPLFGKVESGVVDRQKFIFGSKDIVTYSMSSFFPLGDDLFQLTVDSVVPESSEIERLSDVFNSIAKNIRARADMEIPSEEGSCIEGAFVPLPLYRERVSIGVRLAEFPDVHFSVEVHKNLGSIDEKADLELLYSGGEKAAQEEGFGAIYARINWLRRARRQLGPWNGYEVLARRPAFKNETSVHEFEYQSLGGTNDPLQPALNVQLDTGVNKNRKGSIEPSITDEEAVALWDKLIGSIRVRQPSDATPKPDAAQARTVPLGHIAPAGSACVQSGTWQCDLEGGALRHFKAGDLLPEIEHAGKTTFWQILRGEKNTPKRARNWRLVAYESLPSSPN